MNTTDSSVLLKIDMSSIQPGDIFVRPSGSPYCDTVASVRKDGGRIFVVLTDGEAFETAAGFETKIRRASVAK